MGANSTGAAGDKRDAYARRQMAARPKSGTFTIITQSDRLVG
jgi:hypothetical protein